MGYYDDLVNLRPMALFTMASAGGTERDLMRGPDGTYVGTLARTQTPPHPAMAGGALVPTRANGFTAGLQLATGTYDFAGNAPYSVAFWYKFAVINTLFDRIYGNENGANNQGWMGSYHPDFGMSFSRRTASGIQETYVGATAQNPLVVGTWYHFVGIYSGSTVQAVVNGVAGPVTPAAAAIVASGTNMRICGNNVQTAAGTMVDFGIWNRALTVGEAGLLYEAPRRHGVSY